MFPDDPWKRRQAMMAAQAIREGRMSPVTDPTSPYSQGTSNPYALPPDMQAAVGKDFSGADARIERMQQVAQQLRGTQMPQGKTVGPSNIYVGPNWGEMLAYGANQVMGGLMDKKANEQSKALDPEKNMKARGMALQKALEFRTSAEDAAKGRFIQGQQLDIDRQKMAQQASSDSFEVAYVDKDGKVNNSKTREAYMTPNGLVFRNGEPVDQDRWVRRDDPNLSGSSRGGTINFKNIEWMRNPQTGERLKIGYKDGLPYDAMSNTPLEFNPLDEGFVPEDPMSQGSKQGAVQKLVKDTEGVRQLANSYSDMLTTMERYGIDLASEDPMGRFEKAEGITGDIVRGFKDAFDEGAPAGEVYSSIRGVLNAVIRNQAGLSQTQPEIEKLNKQYGTRWVDDPAVMTKALRLLGPAIRKDMQSMVASVDKTVLQEYRDRLRSYGAEDWTEWGRQAQKGAEDMPDGLPEEVQEVWHVLTEEEKKLWR